MSYERRKEEMRFGTQECDVLSYGLLDSQRLVRLLRCRFWGPRGWDHLLSIAERRGELSFGD